MTDPAHLMQSMIASIQKQTELIETLTQMKQVSELKLEGVKLPTYSGTLDESFALYKQKIDQYFKAKSIAYKEAALKDRMLAVIAGTLKHGAAHWYMAERETFSSVDDFF